MPKQAAASKYLLTTPHLTATCLSRYVRQDSHLWSLLHDGMLTTGEVTVSYHRVIINRAQWSPGHGQFLVVKQQAGCPFHMVSANMQQHNSLCVTAAALLAAWY